MTSKEVEKKNEDVTPVTPVTPVSEVKAAPAPVLDAATLAAINAAVVAAVKAAIPVSPMTSVKEVSQTPVNVNPKNFTHNPQYVKKSRGFPVNPGETWHDLSPAQRKQWFSEHENRWKTRFGIQNKGVEANMNWTRG